MEANSYTEALKFRKKPVVIEAVQWVGDPGEMPVPPAPSEVLRQRSLLDLPWWEIKTIEGWLKLTPGDWIITGVKGERYPCKPDIFAMTYEPENMPPAGPSGGKKFDAWTLYAEVFHELFPGQPHNLTLSPAAIAEFADRVMRLHATTGSNK